MAVEAQFLRFDMNFDCIKVDKKSKNIDDYIVDRYFIAMTMIYPYNIIVDYYMQKDELIAWCEQNCIGAYEVFPEFYLPKSTYVVSVVFFNQEADAVFFKLANS
jgi:hypothetical protein